MIKFCKSDSLLIDYNELKYICFFYTFLLIYFLVWYIWKKHYQQEINKKHRWKYNEGICKNENTEFFNFIYESESCDEVIVRQEGYKNSVIGFLLKNISIFLYVLTHIIIIILIGNEYCIYENHEILWNDRALIFFIFFLLSFIITYSILIVRRHMHSFFLKPALLKDSDYVLVYTKNEEYINVYRDIYKQFFNLANLFFKNCITVLSKHFYVFLNVYHSYLNMIKNFINSKDNTDMNHLRNKKYDNNMSAEDTTVKKHMKTKKIKKKIERGDNNDNNHYQPQHRYVKRQQHSTEVRRIPKEKMLKVYKIRVRTNEENIRYFFFRSMKYVYNEEKDAFYNISCRIKEKVNSLDFNYILKKGGLNNNEIINNINEYGYNNIHLEIFSFFTNMRRELLDGIYMFQLYITYKNFFWKEIITSIIWIVISLLTVVRKILKNQKNKKEIFDNIQANNNTVVTVYRNSVVQQIPSNNLTIGDIIIITPKMTIPCDCILLTGHVLVDESLLTGESRPMKKACVPSGDSGMNWKRGMNGPNSFDMSYADQSGASHMLGAPHKSSSLENNHNKYAKRVKRSFEASPRSNKMGVKNDISRMGSSSSGSRRRRRSGSCSNGSCSENSRGLHKPSGHRYRANNLLYAGTEVISTLNFSDNIYAIVINVSIYTYKGKYMQNVLFPNPLLFKYDSQLPIVFVFTILFSLICLYFQIRYLGLNMTSIFYTLGTLSQILPVWTPVVLNIGLNISTNRLKKEKNICCIAPSRIPICGKIRIFFFDKTGTLTDHNIEFSGVHFCNNILTEKKINLTEKGPFNRGMIDDVYDMKCERPSSFIAPSSKSVTQGYQRTGFAKIGGCKKREAYKSEVDEIEVDEIEVDKSEVDKREVYNKSEVDEIEVDKSEPNNDNSGSNHIIDPYPDRSHNRSHSRSNSRRSFYSSNDNARGAENVDGEKTEQVRISYKEKHMTHMVNGDKTKGKDEKLAPNDVLHNEKKETNEDEEEEKEKEEEEKEKEEEEKEKEEKEKEEKEKEEKRDKSPSFNMREKNSRTSSEDIFQSYDEMEEQKPYEGKTYQYTLQDKKNNVNSEELKKRIEQNNLIDDIAHVRNVNMDGRLYGGEHDKSSTDNTCLDHKKDIKDEQDVLINIVPDLIDGVHCAKKKKKQRKEKKLNSEKSCNEKGEDAKQSSMDKSVDKKRSSKDEREYNEYAPIRSSLFNNSNSSMNSVTSLLYNSKLMWTNKVTLKNTPSNYHLLIYALAGSSCVYYDNNNIYGNEIDKKLFEATEMMITNYTNKHNMDIKRVSLRINNTYKYFDILKMFEFDYYTKTSTTLAYGNFDFKEKFFTVFSKGSFDKIYQKCVKNEELYFFKKKEQEYSKNGFYVIALAFKIIYNPSYEQVLLLSREELEKNMNFLSLIMFSNHIKKDAESVIQTLKSSSIRPVILTGDNAYNCLYVGNRIGLFNNINFYESFFTLSIDSSTASDFAKNIGEKEIDNEKEHLYLPSENAYRSNETKFLSFENFLKSNKGKEGSHHYSSNFMHNQNEQKSQKKNEKKKKIEKEEDPNKNNAHKYSALNKKYEGNKDQESDDENMMLLSRSPNEGERSNANAGERGRESCPYGNTSNNRNHNTYVNNKKGRGNNEYSYMNPVDQKHLEENNILSTQGSEEDRVEENIIVYGYVLNNELRFVNIQNDNKIDTNLVLYKDIYKEIILTGEAYKHVRSHIFHIRSLEEEEEEEQQHKQKQQPQSQHQFCVSKNPEGYKNFLLRIRIFSRLTPNNKMEIIRDFIKFDYICGMCGDGSNDCGALKISHAGLALSNSDSSIVSPFSSKNENLKSVIDILREGRACLVTSINCYKYMLLYGFMISIIKIVLFMNAHAVMSEYGYLFFDNIILLLLAKSMTLSKPACKLKTQTPTSSIVGAQTILSLLCTLIVNFFFFYLIIFQFFYIYDLPSSYDMNTSAPKSSWWLMSDNYESFLSCIWFCFQIVNSALILTFGGKYRKHIFTNYTFMTYYCLINVFLLYLTVGGPNKLTCLFRMNCNDEVSKRTKIKILDAISYSASGLSFYGPNGNNILSTGHKIKFIFLNILNIAINILISKYVLCERLYNRVRKFFNFQNRKVPT
ncbi:cation transporting P-ATPase, putative (ATPase3) [Plasmodium malariae]|uniref:Cation transporting P-ATPase, putative (ATPase3) n=1 Tax=Plasmodium malariae TaxID=5858 RepID=A0A1A8W3I9_PLAMA|nr:cation transporting P-ATPase, putative (ATPase3) [Plasmodium malariae]